MLRFHSNVPERKVLAKRLEGLTGIHPIYTRAPLYAYFICGYREKGETDAHRDIGCTREHFEEEGLNDLVLRGLKAQFELIKKMDNELSEKQQRKFKHLSELSRELETIQEEFKEFQRRKLELYEDYSEGRTAREEFSEKKAELTAAQDGVRGRMESLQGEIEKIRRGKNNFPEFRELVKNVDIFKDEKRLTRSMAEVFLEKVIVHDKFRCEIVWSFEDVVEKVRREIVLCLAM